MTGWKPISTAPKNGTDILLAEKRDNYWKFRTCRWVKKLERWVEYHDGWFSVQNIKPTLWIPLPD